MGDESLVKVNTVPSAGKEVVTSLMTGLIDLAMDKVAVDKVAVEKVAVEKVAVEKVAVDKVTTEKVVAKKVVVDKVTMKKGSSEKVTKKANFVQRKSLEMRGKNDIVSKESVEKVKAGSGSKTATWVEDPNLPPGWKSCIAGDCLHSSKMCRQGYPVVYILLPAPGKAALYYSPCGKLFTNWAQVLAASKVYRSLDC